MATRLVVLVVLVVAIGLSPGALGAQSLGVEPTRLFFAPTARSVPRGDGSLGLTEIAFPWAEFGLLDRVSVRGYVAPPLEDLTSAGIVLGPKLQILRQSQIQAAIGVFQQFSTSGAGGVGYGVVTIGGRGTSATVGLGYGYGSVADSGGSKAVVFVGAEQAVGRSVRLVVEAYVGGEAFGLPEQTLMTGARLSFGRWSLDLGVAIPFYETGSGTPGPIVTIARAF
jgi:hypothetical protein